MFVNGTKSRIGLKFISAFEFSIKVNIQSLLIVKRAPFLLADCLYLFEKHLPIIKMLYDDYVLNKRDPKKSNTIILYYCEGEKHSKETKF